MRVLVLLSLAGCAASGAAIGTAVVNTAIAATASGVRRANGECYTPCNPGTTCNVTNGMCEPIPCRGECLHGERCELSATGDRCVPNVTEVVVNEPAPRPAARVDAGVVGAPTKLELPR